MASKRHLRKRQCEKKVAHDTKESAFLAARRIKKEDLKDLAISRSYLQCYKCPFCKKYHLGNRSGTRKPRRL